VSIIIAGRPEYGEAFGVVGPKRYGKTCYVVKCIVDRLCHQAEIRTVYSNVFLDLRSIGLQHKYRPLDDLEILKRIGDEEDPFPRDIVFIDEIRRYIDSRMSASQKNRFVNNLLADLGKQKVDFYFTEQDENAIDRRIARNIDYLAAPFYDNKGSGMCTVLLFQSRDHYNEVMNLGFGKPLYEFAFWCPPYWGFYRTGQKIEDYKFKFKPEIFGKDFLLWLWKNHPERASDAKLLRYWNTVEGVALNKAEQSAVLTWLELSGETVEAEA